jgi:hypothetical protein
MTSEPGSTAQAPRRFAQHRVAVGVAVAIVDRLEVIEVGHDQRQRV